MINSMLSKIVRVVSPGAIVDNTTPTATVIDTLGYDWCDVYVDLGATDIAVAALKLQESEVSGSGEVDITGANFATGTLTSGDAAALPSATDDNRWFAFRVDCRARKRYLNLVLTGGDGSAGAYFCAFAILSRAAQAPSTMAQRGLTGEIKV